MQNAEEKIRNWFEASIETKKNSAALIPNIRKATEIITDCLRNGGKVLLCGNGGSAADCQHIAAEFVNKMRKDRKPMAAVALTTDTSNITAIGNDYSFADIFKKQVEALGKKGDVLVAISTSGNSENVLRAIDAARQTGILVIGFTGRSGGKIGGKCDVVINVPSDDTQRIQEVHMLIYHSICELVEQEFFG